MHQYSIFVISIIMLHVSCIKRVKGHTIIAYWGPLTYSSNCHIKHGYRKNKYEIRMHTVVHQLQNDASYRSVGYLLIIPWPFPSGKTRQDNVYSRSCIIYRISNKIGKCQLCITKDRMSIFVFVQKGQYIRNVSSTPKTTQYNLLNQLVFS